MPDNSHHLRRLLAVALPAIGAQLAAMMLWVIDVLMLGHLSVEALGSASLGRVWIVGSLGFGLGLLMGLDPIAAQAHGAGDRQRLQEALRDGLYLALLVCLPLALVWGLTGPALLLFDSAPELVPTAASYVHVQIPSLPFMMVYFVLKQYLLAQGIVKPVMWIALGSNLFNACANWVLIFGHFGMPALGATGAGLATALTQVLMLIALIAWMKRHDQPLPRLDTWRWWPAPRAGIARIAVLGLPISIQLGLDLWIWQITTLLAGRLGPVPLAAHTIVLLVASAVFMVPLGLSMAAVSRVGNLIGAGERDQAQRVAWLSLTVAAGIMAVAAVGMWLGRGWLTGLFTFDREVILLGAAIFPIAALFQVFDGVQVAGSGVLRGMGKTRPAAVFNLLGYYGLALPLGAWLALGLGQGLAGLWWGLCAGLAAIAILFVVWVARYGPARSASL